MNTVTKYETDASGMELVERRQASHNWKQDVARRVAAHRNRVNRSDAPVSLLAEPVIAETEERRRAAQIAAAVAARYAAAPSYKEMMNSPSAMPVVAEEATAIAPLLAAVVDDAVEEPMLAGPLVENKKPCVSATMDAVMLATGPELVMPEPPTVAAVSEVSPKLRIQMLPGPPETLAPELLPVRVIESPRELIAVRRMRPRLAEGGAVPMAGGQLRIFEVEADQISTVPEPPGFSGRVPEALVAALAPVWEPEPVREMDYCSASPVAVAPEVMEWEEPVDFGYAAAARSVYGEERVQAVVHPGMRECDRAATIVVQTASLEMRLMSTVVDGCVVMATALAGLLMYFDTAGATATLPSMKVLLLGGGVAFMAMWLGYQMLCIALSGSTLGMRYAGINLITFDDESPTRMAMCGRVLAQLLSLCPLGLGYLWAWMDMDGLGWHDRVTHMYQRSNI